MRPQNQKHSDKLTDRQKRFVDEYMKDQKAGPAAVRAGYSWGSGDETAKLPVVRAEINRRMKIVEEKANVSAAYVLAKLKDVVERCMQAEPVMEWNSETREMERTGEYQFDSSGANKALELLGKSIKLFTDKVEHSAGADAWELLDRFNAAAKKAKNG